MKFNEFKYERPNYGKIKIKFEELVKDMKASSNYEELRTNIDEINKIRNHIESMATLVSIRYSINTQDEFYEKEKEYWDENGPHYEELNSLFYKAIVESKFKDQLTKDLGKQFMSIADYSIQSFSKEIISELQEENKLASEYTKLLASAKIPFDGEERNLSALGPFMTSQFRDEREKASKAYYGFFEKNEEKFDELFDKLVKVRHKMAKKLGFDNFVELGYIRMLRTDYNAEMVSKFRSQVSEYIVPVASELFKRQKERLGLQELRYFDENFEFNSGNATPKGDSDFIMKNGILMYSELSKETDEFFKFMMEHELMDLETKKGKGAGGYCTYIPDYKAPFIFSNFNSTADDIDVLTHEAGHAFQ
ncbi:MAG: M3 family oligoendopeptidase, partial [Cetobacterium sp.]